jgi:hypothetical protein
MGVDGKMGFASQTFSKAHPFYYIKKKKKVFQISYSLGYRANNKSWKKKTFRITGFLDFVHSLES